MRFISLVSRRVGHGRRSRGRLNEQPPGTFDRLDVKPIRSQVDDYSVYAHGVHGLQLAEHLLVVANDPALGEPIVKLPGVSEISPIREPGTAYEIVALAQGLSVRVADHQRGKPARE
jgi:hypothetical protein